MILQSQQTKVERLSARAVADADSMRAHRAALSRWRRRTFGNTDTLAWAFAAGATWGLIRNTGAPKSRLRRKTLAVLNAGWVAYRMLKQNTP